MYSPLSWEVVEESWWQVPLCLGATLVFSSLLFSIIWYFTAMPWAGWLALTSGACLLVFWFLAVSFAILLFCLSFLLDSIDDVDRGASEYWQ